MSIVWTFYSLAYDSLLSFRPYKKLIEDLISKADFKNGDIVVDLGVGTGNLEKSSASFKGVSYYCFDFSDAMLDRAKKKNPTCKYVKYNLTEYKIPLKNNFADKVVSCNVIYNVDNLDLFFGDVYRIMKPGSRFIFTTSIKPGLGPIIRESIIPFKLSDILNILVRLPAFIYIFVINLIIDKSSKYYFYKENLLLSALRSQKFEIISVVPSYAGQNVTVVAEK